MTRRGIEAFGENANAASSRSDESPSRQGAPNDGRNNTALEMREAAAAGQRWEFDEDSNDISLGGCPYFHVYRADDFPCIEDEDREKADADYVAHAHATVFMLNSLLHDSGDTTPIPMPEALPLSLDPVATVPEGMALVPIEPSDTMICWGVEAMWPGNEAVYPDEHEGVEAAIRATWSAMLSASPSPQGPQA